MSNVTITPNMNLPTPDVGVEIGPDWANDNNACFNAIDSHNHTPGQGVQITPDGIDINDDLPLNQNNLITVRTVRFYPQGSAPALPADLGCLCVIGADFYYVDTAGNVIRMTQGGSPSGSSGTITGLPSGTASASFAAGTFSFQSATNTPASMNQGPTKIGRADTSGFGVTISANGATAANYGVTLPAALPAASSFILSDASGNLSFQLASTFASGTFTPTPTAVTNISSFSGVQDMFYTRNNNIVTCYGQLAVAATVGISLTQFRLSLPITPTFSSTANLQGVATVPTPSLGDVVLVEAATATSDATFSFSSYDTVAHKLNYTFSYKIA